MTESNYSQPLGASRSIYYSLTDEVPGLTEEEKNKLESVMKKAMKFEEEEANRLRQPVEGQLYKYTNVVKGWQYRWFILTPDSGMLEYYMVEEQKKSKPRGGMHLAGATVSLGEEDNQSFTVSASYGEIYKLKASDAKDRIFWVDRIRSVVERFSNPLEVKESQIPVQPSFQLCKSSSSIPVAEEDHEEKSSEANSNLLDVSKPAETPKDSLTEINVSVSKALECQKILAKSIESLPISGSNIKCSDNRLLLIKATSQATVQSLEQCYLILRRRKQAYMPSPIREYKNSPFSSSWKF